MSAGHQLQTNLPRHKRQRSLNRQYPPEKVRKCEDQGRKATCKIVRLLNVGRDNVRTTYHALRSMYFKRRHGLTLGRGVKFRGTPVIRICNGGRIVLGNDVTINSKNRGYHLNLHSPVKLFADRPDALITVGDKTRIHGSCLHATNSITIGKNVLIAANCQIFDGNGHDLSFENVENRINTAGDSKPVIIEDSVWIGSNTIILPGIKIGKGSVIGAGSVVSKNIPSMVVAAGNPARVIKKAEQVIP